MYPRNKRMEIIRLYILKTYFIMIMFKTVICKGSLIT